MKILLKNIGICACKCMKKRRGNNQNQMTTEEQTEAILVTACPLKGSAMVKKGNVN